MTHMDVTFKVQSGTPSESECLQVGVQGNLMAVIRVVRSSEWADQFFIRDTSMQQNKREDGKSESAQVVRFVRVHKLFLLLRAKVPSRIE